VNLPPERALRMLRYEQFALRFGFAPGPVKVEVAHEGAAPVFRSEPPPWRQGPMLAGPVEW
jgi:hypothetical protein